VLFFFVSGDIFQNFGLGLWLSSDQNVVDVDILGRKFFA
jgi:hypothetical protein